MGSIDVNSEISTRISEVARIDLKLMLALLPASDIERAKHFYRDLGFPLERCYLTNDRFRTGRTE